MATPQDLTTPQASQGLTPASLAPATPLNVAPVPTQTSTVPPPLPTPPTPNVALDQNEQNAVAAISPYQSIIDQLSGQTSDLAQNAFRTQQQVSTGYNDAQSLATHLYDQNQTLQQQAQGIDLQRAQAIAQKQQAMGGRGIAGDIVNRHSAIDTQFDQQKLTNAIDQYSNSASYYAAQGKVSAALKSIDAAVSAEFTPKLQQLATAQANLKTALASPYLSSAQQKQALNLQAQYTAQENAIKAQAQQKQATGDAKVKVITNNPKMDPTVHAALDAAQSPEEVAAIANHYGLTSLSQQEQLAQSNSDRNFTQSAYQFNQKYAQDASQFNAKQAQDQRQFNVTSNLKQQEITQKALDAGMDPTDMLAYAQQYASTGQIPTGIKGKAFGDIAQLAKEAPKSEGTLVSKSTGIVDSKIPSTEQQDFTRLATIIKNVERLKELDKKRVGGVVSGSIGKMFGNKDQEAYLMVRKAIVDDMSRMQSGAALQKDEVAFYEDYLPGRFTDQATVFGQKSTDKITNFEKVMKDRLTDRLNTNNLSIYGYSKVKLDDGSEHTVGDIITNAQGQTGRVNPDGTITIQ
jgi:deoxycytidylate deaminase